MPGRGALPLSKIDVFCVDAPLNDPQTVHQHVVLEMLRGGQVDRLYRESDDSGRFSVWLTTGTLQGGKSCFYHTTLYERFGGSVEAGFWLACPDEEGWTTGISPDVKELIQEPGG